MAASGRYVNIRNAIFTPTTGSSVTYAGVTNAATAGGGSLLKFAGDGDRFNTTVINDFSDPSITLTYANLGGGLLAGIGSRGVLSITWKDARNQNAVASSGDVVLSLSTATIGDTSFSNPYRQFGTATTMFAAESSDGITSPISITIIP